MSQEKIHNLSLKPDILNPLSGKVFGYVRTALIYKKTTIWRPVRPNLVMYDWASIVGKLITAGDAGYRINGMYLEFNNSGSPVTAPSYTRADGFSYYNSLDGVTADYLRLPMTASTLTSSDPDMFPQGNVATFFAQTAATMSTGVKGLSFGDTANSIVYGGALVAIVDQADRSRDLVFSRFYLSGADQPLKPPTAQIGLEWTIELQ